MKHGNFTGLAEKYSAYRPKYSESALQGIIALLNQPIEKSDLVDVGAGTGIWTRMLADQNPKSITAIEPNEDMRKFGIKDSAHTKIKWLEGSGEKTGLPGESFDMVSMASSFHWVNFIKAIKEFHRILKPNGRFVALWNPRLIEENPLLKELEDYLYLLKPDLNRLSSGKSGITETLTEQLYASGLFTDVVSIEGRHTAEIKPSDYIGAWHSVNDVKVQLGDKKFKEYIEYIESKLINISTLEVTYLTRAWSAVKKYR